MPTPAAPASPSTHLSVYERARSTSVLLCSPLGVTGTRYRRATVALLSPGARGVVWTPAEASPPL